MILGAYTCVESVPCAMQCSCLPLVYHFSVCDHAWEDFVCCVIGIVYLRVGKIALNCLLVMWLETVINTGKY